MKKLKEYLNYIKQFLVQKEVFNVGQKVEVKKSQKEVIADIWARAGRNEPLTTEEYELYIKEVEKRRA